MMIYLLSDFLLGICLCSLGTLYVFSLNYFSCFHPTHTHTHTNNFLSLVQISLLCSRTVLVPSFLSSWLDAADNARALSRPSGIPVWYSCATVLHPTPKACTCRFFFPEGYPQIAGTPLPTYMTHTETCTFLKVYALFPIIKSFVLNMYLIYL